MSKAVLLAANGNQDQRRCIPHALRDLTRLETRPLRLTEIAYEWCSAIYENRENFEEWESLLLVCLELGFRHLDPQEWCISATLTHSEHHRGLADIVFKSQKSEAIADLLHAWTTEDSHLEHAGDMLDICTGHLIDLHNLGPFSPRLRRLLIRFVEVVGCEGFEDAGAEKLVELLDHLHVTAEEMDRKHKWTSLLFGVIRSSEGTQRLSDWHWESLVEVAVPGPWWPEFEGTDALEIAKSLIDSQEWNKLECWIGVMWMSSKSGEIMEDWTVSESAGIAEEDLERLTLLLFRQRPGAAQRLEQWIERWGQEWSLWECTPESIEPMLTRTRETLQRILTQAREAFQREDAP